MKTNRHSARMTTRGDTECMMVDDAAVSKCIIKTEQQSLSSSPTEPKELLSIADQTPSQTNAHIPVNIENSTVVDVTAAKTIHIFNCNPCGIRFSSSSTLGAHQTYYCSHRQKTDSELDEIALGNDTDSRSSSGEPSAKSTRTGKNYKCPSCSYSAEKKVSLNRHMRMHSSSPVSVQSSPCPPNIAEPLTGDKYCQSCDIRFTNQRTYQAHKMHYCGTRRVIQPNQSGSPNIIGPAQPAYLALPTNPVVVVPFALVQNAKPLSSALPTTVVGPSPATDAACIVQPDGTLQPIARAIHPARGSWSRPEEIVSPSKRVEVVGRENEIPLIVRPPSLSPLDLRLTSAVNGSGEEKKTRCDDRNGKSPLDVFVVVQRNDSLQQRVLLPTHAHGTYSKPSQKRTNLPARQQFFSNRGPSKCDSCNIVFCNYVNFLAHKKHYCASRSLPSTLSPGVEVSGTDDTDKTKHERSVTDLNIMEQDNYVQSCVLDVKSVASVIDESAKISKFDAETLQEKVKIITATKSTAAAVIVVVKDDQPKDLLISTKQNSKSSISDLPSQPNPTSNSIFHGQPTIGADQPIIRRSTTTKQCRACNISFNCLSTFIAHKKYYCRNSAEYRFNAENYVENTVVTSPTYS